MKKVLLVQPFLVHYRESLFELLVNDPNIDFNVIAGHESNMAKVFKSKSSKIKDQLRNHTFKLLGHNFFYQSGLFKAIRENKPTNVILGGPDFHFISTIIISFYLIFFTCIKLHYWTHGLSKSNSRIIFFIVKYFYSKAASLLTYEQEGKDEIVDQMEISENKIFVVKNCLNHWDYGFNKSLQDTDKDISKLNILFSGRLTKEKRVDILIKAIDKLVKEKIALSCIIIGEGEYKLELEELTNNLGLGECIEFKGALYDDSLEKYFKSSDIFVLPGKVGLSIIHALSYGLPVITTTLPIHSPEVNILKQDENAFFFKGDSSKNLAKTLLELRLIINKNEITLKNNCINSIVKNGYTPEIMKERFIGGIC